MSPEAYTEGPMWHWFGLSYSAYLVLPRTLLCGMPLAWQEQFHTLLETMRATYDASETDATYLVKRRDEHTGQFLTDPLANYRHPPTLPYNVVTPPADAPAPATAPEPAQPPSPATD